MINTFFRDLDNLLNGGFETPSLVCIGSRPSMGKTSFMLSIIAKQIENEIPVGLISLNETKNQILRRFLSISSLIETNRFKINESGVDCVIDMNGLEFQRIVGSNALWEKYIHFMSKAYSLNEILAEMEIFIRKGVKIIYLDFFQVLIRARDGDLYQESSKIINELKIFANLNNVIIVIASQLNRKSEERPGHRPYLSDLRDSGALEEVADYVIFLHRREYYDPMDRPELAELIVSKHRFGGVGSIPVKFNAQLGFRDFYPLKPEDYKEAEKLFSHFEP